MDYPESSIGRADFSEFAIAASQQSICPINRRGPESFFRTDQMALDYHNKNMNLHRKEIIDIPIDVDKLQMVHCN